MILLAIYKNSFSFGSLYANDVASISRNKKLQQQKVLQKMLKEEKKEEKFFQSKVLVPQKVMYLILIALFVIFMFLVFFALIKISISLTSGMYGRYNKNSSFFTRIKNMFTSGKDKSNI